MLNVATKRAQVRNSDKSGDVAGDSGTGWWLVCTWITLNAYEYFLLMKGNTYRLFNLKCIMLYKRKTSYSMRDHFNVLIISIIPW